MSTHEPFDTPFAPSRIDANRPMDAAADARRNLVANFRSVNVQGAADPGPDRLGPPARVLTRWLDEYHAAYVDANLCESGGSLHVMQGRTLTLAGDHLLGATEDVAAMVRAALRGGMSTTLAVTVTAMAAQAHAVAALRGAVPLQYRIDCTELGPQSSPQALAACRATLTAHVEAGGNVSLVGDVATLRAAGLLADELFNRNFLTITPHPHPETRRMNRPHALAPCRDYIAWYIDEAGDIYPCAGMLGHAPARFGSLHEPFSRLIDALAYSAVSIDSLSRRGPRIADDQARFPADLCALHRLSVHGIATL
jgi:hypothetical protein